FALLLLSVSNECLKTNNTITIKTVSSGTLRGQLVKVLGHQIGQFLNIPYAEPPVDRLRFAKPVPLKASATDTVRDATKPGNSCMQSPSDSSLHESEDCLVLNIWTPIIGSTGNSSSSSVGHLKPVMFWIHGGAFNRGSIFMPQYYGHRLATYDVVVVSINYRLGMFGFLYGGYNDEYEEGAPGNVGLYDQLLALKWVRDNIHMFGGNKSAITLFGQGAGAISTTVHILSPLSRGLFARAIIESGAEYHYWGRPYRTPEESLDDTHCLAKQFGCSADWLLCLRNVSADKLVKYTDHITYPLEGTPILPASAQYAFGNGSYAQNIDIMAGVVKDEGYPGIEYDFPDVSDSMTERLFNLLVNEANDQLHGIDVKAVDRFYLQHVNKYNPDQLWHAFARVYGDVQIKCPTYLFAKQYALHDKHHTTNSSSSSVGSRVYFYELTYRSQVSTDCQTTGRVCHGSDLPFVFGVPLNDTTNYNITDITFSTAIMQMWTEFVKYGAPGPQWPLLLNTTANNITNYTSDVSSMTNVRELNPWTMATTRDLHHTFAHTTCDTFWRNYFQPEPVPKPLSSTNSTGMDVHPLFAVLIAFIIL
ncbi:cholinesterase 1-like, partial [Oppia nitens]|uniref:cholinesterase 1-like n=1 Tax=Oppia nitens TaxID=1686743 RepID=UPI0023D9930B